ncbi:MAG: hypothetical protein F6K00_21695 [Leptolyngbya sp. SIOISBB]|nr:hypothetical protein [Leptolyngbya sp. SIOISBB]
MKSDADTIRNFLIGLLEHFSRIDSSPSGPVDDLTGNSISVSSSPDQTISTSTASKNTYDSAAVESSSTFSQPPSTEIPPISEFGELPSVQDHFQTVLKRRLQLEISQNPPRFPWESNVTDYPVELAESSAQPWMLQLRSLPLPTALPDDILAGLLNRCQELIAESLQPGVQLIKAVENLFPDQPQAMDQIAGLVLANATVRSTATRDVAALKAAFPEGYAGANPQQQVTLTMLAAKEILNTLTLTLTPGTPTQHREWLTAEGNVAMTVHYQAAPTEQISLSVNVPCPSQITMPTLGQTVTQTRPGILNLTLPELADGTYPVEICFSDTNTAPLTFALRWSHEA